MATAVAARSTRSAKPQAGSYTNPAAMAAAGALAIEETVPLTSKHKPLNSSSWAVDALSEPLVVESTKAFRVLLLAPLVVWWVAIFMGMWVYEGLPKGQRVYHVMTWFDSGILRPAGSLVPFAVLGARAAVHLGAHVVRHGLSGRGGSGSSGGRGTGQRRVALRLGSLLMHCLALYTVMAVARMGIYLAHFWLLKNRYLEFHIVSDHTFLAATMLISLHAEMICLMSDMMRAIKGAGQAGPGAVAWREVVLTLLFVVALFLYLFTAADMYYTAKYFHFPMESFTTTVLVFLLFQLPMLFWLANQRRLK